jgi:hypothetical protein
MPRFYFNVRDGETVYLDNEGTELDDLEAAVAEAHKDILYIYNEMLLPGAFDGQRIEVVDEQGQVVATVAFADVVRLN